MVRFSEDFSFFFSFLSFFWTDAFVHFFSTGELGVKIAYLLFLCYLLYFNNSEYQKNVSFGNKCNFELNELEEFKTINQIS